MSYYKPFKGIEGTESYEYFYNNDYFYGYANKAGKYIEFCTPIQDINTTINNLSAILKGRKLVTSERMSWDPITKFPVYHPGHPLYNTHEPILKDIKHENMVK